MRVPQLNALPLSRKYLDRGVLGTLLDARVVASSLGPALEVRRAKPSLFSLVNVLRSLDHPLFRKHSFRIEANCWMTHVCAG